VRPTASCREENANLLNKRGSNLRGKTLLARERPRGELLVTKDPPGQEEKTPLLL